jgi:hypothetical protein
MAGRAMDVLPIETARLVLRRFTLEDLESFQALLVAVSTLERSLVSTASLLGESGSEKV